MARKKAKKKGKRHASSRGTGRKNRPVKSPAARPPEWAIGLTEYQRRFVEAYLIEPNATRAAITAGYSKRSAYSTGQENLKKPVISAALERARAKRTAKAESDGDMVIAELECLGFSHYRDYFTEYDHGELKLKKLSELTEKQSAAVESLDVTEVNLGSANEPVLVQQIRLKLYGKVKPLELLGKHHGVIKENLNIPPDIPINIITFGQAKKGK